MYEVANYAGVSNNTPQVVQLQSAASQLPALNSAYATGQTQTSTMSGGTGNTTVHVETDDVSNIQRVVQFSIDNTDAASTAQKLRLGSIAAAKDAYANYGLTSGAADNNKIQDELGLGCKKVQAFSQFVSFKPVITSKVKVICTDVNQLQESLIHFALQMDGSQPTSTTYNMAYTQGLSDNRTNLVSLDIAKVLDSTHYFQYTIQAGVKLTFFVEIAGFSNNETFTRLMGIL